MMVADIIPQKSIPSPPPGAERARERWGIPERSIKDLAIGDTTSPSPSLTRWVPYGTPSKYYFDGTRLSPASGGEGRFRVTRVRTGYRHHDQSIQ